MLIEIAKGTVANRSIFIEPKELIQHLEDGKELFKSYFAFDDKVKQHILMGRKTAQGFNGEFHLQQLILDIDRGTDSLEKTIHRTKELANKLIKDFDLEDNFQIWFSGTGFHIHLPNIFDTTPSKDLPEIIRASVEAYFPEADTKPIHARGLIRVGRTINNKSKLYKIPIRESEIWFLTEEQVVNWSATPRKDVPVLKTSVPDKLYEPIIPKKKIIGNTIATFKPNRIVTCMQHCYNAGSVEGTRHERLLSMSSWLYRAGIPIGGTTAMMKSYVGESKSMTEYEIEKIVHDLYFKGGYDYGCDSKVMKEFCDKQCMFYAKRNYLPEVFGHKEIEKNYKNDMDEGWEENSLNLASFFNVKDSRGYWLRPGHLVGVIADSGLSKSALLQNIALKFKEFGDFLYINTEMPYEELFERFIQIEYGMTSLQVRNHYINKGDDLSSAIKHIKYSKTVPNYDGIVELTKKVKPKVLVIDVIDDIKPSKDRSINSQEDMYAGLKALAVDMKVVVFLVHHISKSSAVDEKGNSKTLNKHSAKGSSAFEQKCDVMIGVEGNPDTPYRVIRHLKGRSTPPFVASYFVSATNFQYKLVGV